MKIQVIKDETQPKSTVPLKKKKKKSKRHPILKFIITTVIILVLFVVLAISPLFKISEIDVSGNKHNTSTDIIAASGITTGSNAFKTMGFNLKNIFTLSYGASEKRITDSYPYVKQASVRLVIPGKISIKIIERVPAFMVPYTGTTLIIDEDGFVTEAVDDISKVKLPVINGLSFDNYKPGQKLKLKNEEAFQECNELIKAIKDSDNLSSFKLYSILKSIDAADAGNIKFLLDSRIKVNFGDLQDLSYRITFLKEIYQKQIKKNEKGILDFTEKNPRFTPDK